MFQDIGSALGTTSCIIVMVKKHEDYADLYDEVFSAVKDMPLPLWFSVVWADV